MSIYEHLHEKKISYSFFNYSDKVIKYATVYLYFKNDVNDVVSDVVSGSDYYWYVETGPFEPVQEYEFNYNIPIKNKTANFVYVDKVEVEYMDGTKITYAGNSLHVLLDNDGKTPYQ